LEQRIKSVNGLSKSSKTLPVIEPLRASSGPTDEAYRQPLPPLRLYHLFALTAVASILFTFQGPRSIVSGIGEGGVPRGFSLVIAIGVIYTLFFAIAITFVSFAVFWHRRGIWTFSQPGHWLLVSIAATGAVGLMFALFRELTKKSLWRWNFSRQRTSKCFLLDDNCS
jgi:hypothetical protein